MGAPQHPRPASHDLKTPFYGPVLSGVMFDAELTNLQARVLAAISSVRNPSTGNSVFSQSDFAKKIQCSRESINRACRFLETTKRIRVVQRLSVSNGWWVNVYRVCEMESLLAQWEKEKAERIQPELFQINTAIPTPSLVGKPGCDPDITQGCDPSVTLLKTSSKLKPPTPSVPPPTLTQNDPHLTPEGEDIASLLNSFMIFSGETELPKKTKKWVYEAAKSHGFDLVKRAILGASRDPFWSGASGERKMGIRAALSTILKSKEKLELLSSRYADQEQTEAELRRHQARSNEAKSRLKVLHDAFEAPRTEDEEDAAMLGFAMMRGKLPKDTLEEAQKALNNFPKAQNEAKWASRPPPPSNSKPSRTKAPQEPIEGFMSVCSSKGEPGPETGPFVSS